MGVTAREKRVLASGPWGISAIVLWEIGKLAQEGLIEADLDHPRVVRALSGVHIWPIDLAVVRAIRRLDFRKRPADEMIAATSLVHDAPLVTRDRVLRRSKIVPLAG